VRLAAAALADGILVAREKRGGAAMVKGIALIRVL